MQTQRRSKYKRINEPENLPIHHWQDADALISALSDALADVQARTDVSGTSVAINSSVLRTTSRVFQATFSTLDWSGELTAFTLTSEAEIDTQVWQVNDELPYHSLAGPLQS